MAAAIRCVSLNTWKCDGQYRDRLHWMADGLSALKPDIVCLQEAFVCEDLGLDTARFLAETLGLHMQSLPARLKRRQFAGADRDSWSNLAILSKWPGQLLPNTKLKEHPKDNERWAMQLRLDIEGQAQLNVINTHLTHVRDDEGAATRYQQAQQLRELVQKLIRAKNTVILCGDMNALAASHELSPLNQIQWLQALEDVEGGTMQGAAFSADRKTYRIDHIFVASNTPSTRLIKRWPSLNAPIGPNGEFPSDHAALVVDLEIQ